MAVARPYYVGASGGFPLGALATATLRWAFSEPTHPALQPVVAGARCSAEVDWFSVGLFLWAELQAFWPALWLCVLLLSLKVLSAFAAGRGFELVLSCAPTHHHQGDSRRAARLSKYHHGVVQ